MNIILIGVGGVGSLIATILGKQSRYTRIIAFDGDVLEHKNLDRQFYREEDVGMPKVQALANTVPTIIDVPEYFAETTDIMRHDPSVIIVAVDNNPARAAALALSDKYKIPVIVGANETYSAEAYIYWPEWKGTARDPRVMYPEILSDRSGDPMLSAGGCAAAARDNPQLIGANTMAAALTLHLLESHIHFAEQVPHSERAQYRNTIPSQHVSSVSTIHSQPVPSNA